MRVILEIGGYSKKLKKAIKNFGKSLRVESIAKEQEFMILVMSIQAEERASYRKRIADEILNRAEDIKSILRLANPPIVSRRRQKCAR